MIEQRAGYIQGKPPKDRVGPVVSLIWEPCIGLTLKVMAEKASN